MSPLAKQCATGAAAAIVALAGVAGGAGVMAQNSEIRVESGGESAERFDAMMARADDFSLKVILAARGSGAYLADVDVAVVSLPARQTVLEHRTQGPLLLASLPPGRYEVTATFADVLPGKPNTVKRAVVVPRSGLAQAVLYFDTGD